MRYNERQRFWRKAREGGKILKRPLPIINLIGPADVITLLNFMCGVWAAYWWALFRVMSYSYVLGFWDYLHII